ncbi:SpaH/EbpB family LPXTG-anchored major pilin [Glutamicibacter sp. TV12E]|uniref:SpaH/EbpB family LPXTG-anchored major pilin n=1 Tax=Glutamicibacter sp. TV12E TaxID=3446362 RepID=UPI004034C38C
MFSEQRLGKLIAGASALALAGAGLLGATAAAADDAPGIDSGMTGSISIHKSSATPGEAGDGNEITPDPGLDKELAGVEFTLQQVLHDGSPIDLSTAEGWELSEAVTSTGSAPSLPSAEYTLGASTATTTDASGVATFSGLNLGLYLVTETKSGDNLISQKHDPFWVTVPYPNEDGSWNYNVHVYPKNLLNEINLSKTVDDTAQLLGDNVTWTLETTVPASDLPYESFTLTDVLPAQLTFVSWGALSLNGAPLDAADYEISADNTEISLTGSGLAKLDSAGEATFTISMVTTVNAIPEDGKVVNEASLTINGTTVKDPANTNLGTIKLIKTDEGDQILAGAKFELYAEAPVDGEPTGDPIATATTNDSGEIIWQVHVGIDDDLTETYWVRETVAPAGFVLPANPWSEVPAVDAGATAELTISNHKADGPDLPLTGAQGTLLFTLAGIGLMAVAGGAVLVQRRARQRRAE